MQGNDWMLIALVILLVAGMIALLVWLSLARRRRNVVTPIALIEAVNSLLPQTQCGQCGYSGCRPYARAVVAGTALNQCPPGGSAVIEQLAVLLRRPILPLNPVHGVFTPPRVAVIREAECIGCTKCIQACPVDAILGATKLMHTVIAHECTGCDLCVAPCPVDCIDMLPLPGAGARAWPLPTLRRLSA